MTLTAERDTQAKDGKILSVPVAASTKILAGALVAINASSLAVPGATSTTLKAAGRANQTVDNTAGAAGALSVEVEKGVFKYKNSTAGDLITLADHNNDCFIVDDEQVAKTNGGSTRSIAGKVYDVDATGVWVKFL